jgi:hypothetical protein
MKWLTMMVIVLAVMGLGLSGCAEKKQRRPMPNTYEPLPPNVSTPPPEPGPVPNTYEPVPSQ